MHVALPAARTLPRLDWRMVAWACYLTVNIALLPSVRFGADNIDWSIWVSLSDALARHDLYADAAVPFVWSPAAGYAMAGVSLMGYWPWVALHVAFVLLLRDWRLIAAVLVSYPFWVDAALGNVMTFQVVAGMLALRGRRGWSLTFLALAVLIPRPVVFPLAAWLLWRRPDVRWPFAVMLGALGVTTVASGYAGDWLTAALSYGNDAARSIGPTALIGTAWLLVGVPLGAWLWWRGRLGLAGLAVSPYLFPYYLLALLWELGGSRADVLSAHAVVLEQRKEVRCLPFRR